MSAVRLRADVSELHQPGRRPGQRAVPDGHAQCDAAVRRTSTWPDRDYTVRYGQSRDRTTNAIRWRDGRGVRDQPLNFLFWYDKPSKTATCHLPGLSWFNAVPTTWDESRTRAGSIGQYVAVARRDGFTWYLGTDDRRDVPDAARSRRSSSWAVGTYMATIYSYGTSGADPYQTPVVVTRAPSPRRPGWTWSWPSAVAAQAHRPPAELRSGRSTCSAPKIRHGNYASCPWFGHRTV